METESAYFDVGIQSIIFVARNTSYNEITNLEDCGSCPVFASYILAFALQLRKKHGLRFFHAFSSVIRQMPGYNSQRWGTARTLPN
jgi:hypothetical protein